MKIAKRGKKPKRPKRPSPKKKGYARKNKKSSYY